MANDNIFLMSESEHENWLQSVGCSDPHAPSEENIARLVSEAIRCTDRVERAQYYMDVANMSLALADKTLGAQSSVAKCLILTTH